MRLMIIKKSIIYLLLVCSYLFPSNLYSEELEIGISQGSIKPTPIAVTDFFFPRNEIKKNGQRYCKSYFKQFRTFRAFYTKR